MNLELMAYLTDHNRLWAIDESYLLRYKAAAEAHDGIQLEARAPSSSMAMAGNVALIDVSGPISPRATIFTELFGGAAISSLQADFRQAMADDSVKAIVFHYDTPGGEVSAVSDFAAEIFAARGKKPIVAQIGSLCASAGYWLASAADKIVSTKAGLSGSIGVITMHADVSAALEQEGVKVTVISAGTYKAEGSPYSALSADAAAHVQSLVDAAYDDFTGDVAQGRGVTAAQVKKGYGEGRVLSSKAAKAAGLIDSIATLDSTLSRLVGRKSAGGMRAESGQKTLEELAQHPAILRGGLRADVKVMVCECSEDCPCQNGGVCGENCPTCEPGCACVAPETETATPMPMPSGASAAQMRRLL